MAEPRAVRRSDFPVGTGTVFLVGVAGAGMRGLATVFADLGWRVLGADRDADAAAELARSGIELHPEADGSAVTVADLVVYSSAVPPDHPARVAAREAGIPAWKRSRALGALVNDSCLAAVAGTHGKTTVTAMLARVLEAAGRDPLALVGGQVAGWEGNARRGRGDITVVEADEYDRSFLDLDPDLAIVTSVEPEHLDVYGDVPAMVEAYRQFASRAARVLVCADDAGARSLGDELAGAATVRTYGFDPTADYRVAAELREDGGQLVTLGYREEVVVSGLAAPGRHNAQNAGAALAAAAWLGCVPAEIADSLVGFSGVERRLQVLHRSGELVVVDDYAHHPTEVEAGIAALRSVWPGRRLVVVFQPHLFSRTRDQAAAFRRVLTGADAAYVLPIYPAREAPIPGVTRDLITSGAEALRGIESYEIPALAHSPGPKLIAFMGAGDVTRLAHELARSAARRTHELGG